MPEMDRGLRRDDLRLCLDLKGISCRIFIA
jgi:hypothetical protein